MVLVSVSAYSSWKLGHLYYDLSEENLISRTEIIREKVHNFLAKNDYENLNTYCSDVLSHNDIHVTVMLEGGKVIADSSDQPWDVATLANEPEIRKAVTTGMGSDIRVSGRFGNKMLFYAVAVKDKDGNLKAIIRTAKPVGIIDDRLRSSYLGFGKYGLFIILISGMLCWGVSRKISRPIEEVQRGVENFAKGNLNYKLAPVDSEELSTLTITMNKMADELDDRIRSLTRNRNELEAVLSSMAEGVIAVNSDGHIVSINRAACEILGIEQTKAKGKSIEEVVRDTQLQDFVKNALEGKGDKIRKEIVLPDKKTRFLHAYGRLIEGTGAGEISAIIVLDNVTHVKWLENVRREFVANVSHELKTPITSIKGFVETLLDGAIEKPEEARRFLKIIARHTNRLNAIIEDILILSRVEDESERTRIPLEDCRLNEVLFSAVETCYMKAKEKSITINVNCDDTYHAELNAFMMEQALVNIIDNAIKYSRDESHIEVSATVQDDHAFMSVTDNGYGIPPDHIDRIFERFYVTDKARSRKLGGTGLGLAIVKHIAQAHGGKVTVESMVGKGSTFTISIPCRAQTAGDTQPDPTDTSPGGPDQNPAG